VHGSQGMVKSRMVCPGINQVAESHLRYPAQALKVRMGNQVENQVVGNPYKSVNWIIKYL